MLFTQDMMAKEVRIRELTLLAEKLKVEHYTEYEMIREMIEVRKNVLTTKLWVLRDDDLLTALLSVRIPYLLKSMYKSIWKLKYI